MKIITLNIEKDAHLDTVRRFMREQRPAIFCLQEVTKAMVNKFSEELELDCSFCPMTSRYGAGAEDEQWGIAILSSYPSKLVYRGSYENFTNLYPPPSTQKERPLVSLLIAEISANNRVYTVGTTHFTWTPNGGVTDEQRVNLGSLLKITDRYPELILCGDFNAPRGLEIYQALATRFQDTLPLSVESTIDPELHRAKLSLVVDAVFIPKNLPYTAATIATGVSDHCPVVLNLE